ncbi:MAG: LCP family protein [Actinomycetota bacterium]|nr:LCP family protein [Actinomycetota bacterium]
MKRAVGLCVAIAAVCFLVPMLGPSVGSASPILVGRVHATYQPNDGKIFILVIGNDARSGNPDAARADALHIVGINTHTMRGGILNFPRDSWINIPGHGSGKINETLQDGGPEFVATTLEQLTGIHIDYWVMTGFQGFVGLLKRVGGIPVHVPIDLNDPSGSGAKMSAGYHKLYGLAALSFVRDRHDFPQGDLDRTTNQASFLVGMLKKLRSQVSKNPAEVFKWIAAGREYTRFDLPAEEMFRLGILATQLKPRRMGIVTVPATTGSVGAESVVYISSSANAIYARFRKNGSL